MTHPIRSLKKQGAANPKARHITILAADGRVGGLPTIADAATWFGVTPNAMEARLRRSHAAGGHPGWSAPGHDGRHRAWFTDMGDPLTNTKAI